MRPSYKLHIKIGAIEIPVSLFNVIKTYESNFKLIDRNTMSKIQYRKIVTDNSNQELLADDIIKGYEFEKNKFIVFSDDEINVLKCGLNNQIKIFEFVKKSAIKWYMLNKAYYLKAEEGYETALLILEKALKRAKLAGIGKTILGNKEYLVTFVEDKGKLILYTLQYNDEIYEYEKLKLTNLDKKYIEMATNIIKLLERPFIFSKYQDEFQKRLEAAIPIKIQGETITAADTTEEDILNHLTAQLQKIILSFKDKT